MTPRNLTIFIAIDLAVLLFILLLLSYFGMSHLMILLMGLIFMVLTFYDLQTGVLTAFFSNFLGFENATDLGRLKYVPLFLSALLLFLSIPVLLEHGLVNEGQRWAMQQGNFLRIAIPAIVGGAVVIAAAAWTVYRGRK